MTTYNGRSPIEVAEEELLFAATQQYGLRRINAVSTLAERYELGEATRKEAEKLLTVWEGTYEQCAEATQLGAIKAFAIKRGI